METPPIENTKTSPARPVIVTVTCVIGFLGSFFALQMIYPFVARNTGEWFAWYLVFGALVGLACMIGFWKMRKWAVSAYLGLLVLNQVVMKAMDTWNLFALLIPGIIFGIMFYYLPKMK